MSETLIIKNFGPIKDMSFEFKKINVFIGDQGTGKSTVGKLLSAIKNTSFLTLFDVPEDDTHQFYGHLDLVGIKNYVKDDSVIIYKSSYFRLELINGKVFIINNMSFDDSFNYRYTYVPAERNMVSVLADSLYALLEVKAELPKLFLRFGNKFQSARKLKEKFEYQNILGVNFTHKNNRDYILMSAGDEINLSEASSGIQGSVVLLTVFDSVISESQSSLEQVSLLDKNLRLLVIEEPELNCFPQTQNKLIKYIVANNNISGVQINQLIITTHSPYVLTTFNNLIYAFSVGQNHTEEVNGIIENKYWINPNEVSAYMLLPDGTCEDIVDREENLIRAEKIDSVSGFLNEQFEALLNIELVQK